MAHHELRIDSDLYTPVTNNRLPTGEALNVEDTVFDFREPTRFGKPFLLKEGLCPEFQHIPDSPTFLWFSSTALLPGETYTSKVKLEFEKGVSLAI